jgi:hypothetical protein
MKTVTIQTLFHVMKSCGFLNRRCGAVRGCPSSVEISRGVINLFTEFSTGLCECR